MSLENSLDHETSDFSPRMMRSTKTPPEQCLEFAALLSEREELEEQNHTLSCDYGELKVQLRYLEHELATAAEQHERHLKAAVAAAFKQAYKETSNHQNTAGISNIRKLVSEFLDKQEVEMQASEQLITLQESFKTAKLETAAAQNGLKTLQQKCSALEAEVQQLTYDLGEAVQAGLQLDEELGEARDMLLRKTVGWTPRRVSVATSRSLRSLNSLQFVSLVSSTESDGTVSQGTRYSIELDADGLSRTLSVMSAATLRERRTSRVEKIKAEIKVPTKTVSFREPPSPTSDMSVKCIRRSLTEQPRACIDDIVCKPSKRQVNFDDNAEQPEHASYVSTSCSVAGELSMNTASTGPTALSAAMDESAAAPVQPSSPTNMLSSVLGFVGLKPAAPPRKVVLPEAPRSPCNFSQGVDELRKEELRKWLDALEAEAHDLRLSQAAAFQ